MGCGCQMCPPPRGSRRCWAQRHGWPEVLGGGPSSLFCAAQGHGSSCPAFRNAPAVMPIGCVLSALVQPGVVVGAVDQGRQAHHRHPQPSGKSHPRGNERGPPAPVCHRTTKMEVVDLFREATSHQPSVNFFQVRRRAAQCVLNGSCVLPLLGRPD